MPLTSTDIKHKARRLGFNIVGITPSEPSPSLNAYLHWVEQGMHGKMDYLARPDRIARRKNLKQILSNAESLIVVGMDYRSFDGDEELFNDPSRGRIASYAWGLDYHNVLKVRLEMLAEWIQEQSADKIQHRAYVDTGAILERSHAQQAGLGFIGKNTMLIHPQAGSYFFIGEIISSLQFDEYDSPHRQTMCGTCTRCITACPTHAFPKPYVLDSRLCISYHTIENQAWIARELRPKFGNWIFGCDICQDACPFQRFASETDEVAFLPLDTDRIAPKLSDLLTITEEQFKEKFRRTPIARLKRERLVRNACIAAGNWAHPHIIPFLIQLLYDDSALVRGHAAWALWQTMGLSSSKLLSDLYYREEDENVRSEIEALLE